MPPLTVEAPGSISVAPDRRDRSVKFVRDLFFANIPLPFQKLRTYAWAAVFSRTLGPAGFGTWSLFLTTLGICMILSSMTQGNALMRFLGGERNRREESVGFSSAMATMTLSASIVTIGLLALSPRVSRELFHDERGWMAVLLIAAIIPFETWFEGMRSILRARRMNRIWAGFTLARQFPEMLLLVACAFLWRRQPNALIFCYLVTAILGVVIGLRFLYIRGFRLTLPSTTLMRKYIPYGLVLVPGALASSLSFAADKYLVAYYRTMADVGTYSLCFTISALGFFFVGPLNDVLLPEMAALYDGNDWNVFYRRFASVQKCVVGLAIGATALLLSFPSEILGLVSSKEYLWGVPTLRVLGLQGVWMGLVMLYVVILMVQLRTWWATATWAGMGALIIAIDLVLLPRIGILGAAISQVLSSVIGAAAVIGLNWEIFRRSFRFKWVFKACAALTAVWLSARLWPGNTSSIAMSITKLLVGSAVFVFILFACRYISRGELSTIWEAVLRRRASNQPCSGEHS
jgi:O-antigen/teichoic acid export membrane protein